MKKNILFFILGILLTLLCEFIFGLIIQMNNNYSGLTLFEEKRNFIKVKQIKIFQTLEPNVALAHATSKPNAILDNNEIVVLIVGDDNTNYYDEQKIDIKKGQNIVQIGTYRYMNSENFEKTVPAVEIQ